MNNEWRPFPEHDDDPSRRTPSGTPTGNESLSTPPPAAANHGEDTRVLPPFGAPEPTAPGSPRRRSSLFPAAVLAGALVVGGAAGVGGAAVYDSSHGDSSTAGDFTASSSTNASNAANSTATGVEGVAQKLLPSVVQINVTGNSESGTGSGIVLSKDGTILTNNHVASVAGNGGSMTVNLQDGRSVKATLVGADPVTDLAVIKAAGVDDLTPAELGKSSDLKVGQPVVAVGSPFGLGATVTSGIVSALDRAVSVSTSEGQDQSDPFSQGEGGGQPSTGSQSTTYPAIQTDASINPGNSGGPLVNMAGQVVGINSAIRSSGDSSSEGGSIGIGFAIPIDEALPIVNQLKDGQDATHARLGVSVADNATSQGGVSNGAVVKSVESGGAAASAGLKVGDIVTKVDDLVIQSSDDLVATIRGHRPGEDVTLTVLRSGKKQTIKATLGSDEGTSTS
ncbi:MAG: hypothetical protein JWO46_3323 [Nocardioidaceae bacterium]|nr:hypothetical protein [Nocardioidaceae bacterium]